MRLSRAMSKREYRVARAWLPYYQGLEAKPARGAIVPGMGLNMAQAMDEASSQGYYVSQYKKGAVTLH